MFEAFGIELEYMIVDADTLDVRPICDLLMIDASGSPLSELDRDDGTSWSNELAAHVVELKTTEPSRAIVGADSPRFQSSAEAINALLARHNARLMPSAMHPWMDPRKEMHLWAHEYSEVYQTFDRLFDCKRHGWANLQSVHLNLPFSSDAEFATLHAAVRLILPILPALTASSPFIDGRTTGFLCNRLDVYRSNQAKVPSLTGLVIPERAFSQAEYERQVLEPIARAVAMLDSSGTMKPQWMNSRGAIARFDRGSIEIRVMDVQECPAADLAIVAGVVGVLRWLAARSASSATARDTQRTFEAASLRAIFDNVVQDGELARITDSAYLHALGIESPSAFAGDVWVQLLHSAGLDLGTPELAPLGTILDQGPLARRMLRASGAPRNAPVDRDALRAIASSLCDCLRDGSVLLGSG